MTFRKEHLVEAIRQHGGEFFSRESNLTSLVTITRVEVTDDMKHADIFISVFPESKETEAVHFAKRQRSELREYILKSTRTRSIPFLEVYIDQGEKNRVRMDELGRQIKTTEKTEEN